MTLLALQAPAPIDASHLHSTFDSGEPHLDEWLKKRALKIHASGASRCFVLCNGEQFIGYYSLSAGAISHAASPKALRRNMPDPLPVLLLGRLAIDKHHQNQGIGQALLRDAMSEQAKRFYLSRGFVLPPHEPMTLLMTIETLRCILAEPTTANRHY